MLFLQGVMFYVPHYLWKTFEDKKMHKITSGLRGKTFNTDGRRDACENLINYLWETRGMHNAYAFKWVHWNPRSNFAENSLSKCQISTAFWTSIVDIIWQKIDAILGTSISIEGFESTRMNLHFHTRCILGISSVISSTSSMSLAKCILSTPFWVEFSWLMAQKS